MDTGYHLPNTISHKLSPQRVGPFTVVKPVGKLAFELDIPPTWKIHRVISIAHLEPYKADPFDRSIPALPDTIADDDGEHQEWEVEEIVNHRFNRRRKREEWFVKWKNCGPEQNTWEPIENLSNSLDVLDEFRSLHNPVTVASTFFLPSTHPRPLVNTFLSTVFSP
jgi:hypothetical protein